MNKVLKYKIAWVVYIIVLYLLIVLICSFSRSRFKSVEFVRKMLKYNTVVNIDRFKVNKNVLNINKYVSTEEEWKCFQLCNKKINAILLISRNSKFSLCLYQFYRRRMLFFFYILNKIQQTTKKRKTHPGNINPREAKKNSA